MYIKENFYWWMSEDDLLGGNDKCLYSEWINTTSNGGYIELLPKPTSVVDTGSDTTECLLPVTDPITDGTKMLAFTDSGVFRENTVWAVSTEAWVTTNFIIWNKLYMVKNNWPASAYTLYEESTSTAYGSGSWSETLVTTTNPLQTADYDWYMKGVCVVWDIAYIFLGSQIARFSPNDWNEVIVYDIFGDDIVWVTRVGWYLKVYTKSGRLLLWDWNKETITESVNLNTWLEAVYQQGNIEFVYTGYKWGEKWLYYIDWYTLTPVVKNTYSNLLNISKFSFQYGSTIKPMASLSKQLLWYTEDINDKPRLYKFWKDIEWLPNAISYYGKYSSYWLENIHIRSVNTIWNHVYYGFFDWVNKWVDKIDTKGWYKLADWEIITNTNTVWYWIFKKTAKYIYFKVADVDADRTIDVDISFDWWDFTNIGTVNEMPLDWIARLPVQGDFRDYNVKFTLKTLITTSRSPKIYYWYAFDFEQHNI